MIIEPINGYYNMNDTIDIVSRIINVKIQFHEDKIKRSKDDKFIKLSKNRIVQLQKDLYNITKYIEFHDTILYMKSTIVLSESDSLNKIKRKLSQW